MNKFIYNKSNSNEMMHVDIYHKDDESICSVREYISDIYKSNYEAKIEPHTDFIVHAHHIGTSNILACAGISLASPTKQLFSEKYVARNLILEALSKNMSGIHISEIVEIGSLASDSPSHAADLIKIIPMLIWLMGFKVIMCTATRELRVLLKYHGIPFEVLGDASPDILTEQERETWGSYYEHDPKVGFIYLNKCGQLFNKFCGKLIPHGMMSIKESTYINEAHVA